MKVLTATVTGASILAAIAAWVDVNLIATGRLGAFSDESSYGITLYKRNVPLSKMWPTPNFG
ncbi:hypothetical protein [Nocardia nova]